MKTLRQTNIKNSQNYFFNSMTNIKNFDPSLLSIDQIPFKGIDIFTYNIKYIKNFDCANSLYLIFNNVDAYIGKDDEDKYLIFASTNKNKEALENYVELWDEFKDQIELISDNRPIEYKKAFMKIKFKSDDELPLDKILNIPVCIINNNNIMCIICIKQQQLLSTSFFYMYVFMSMNMNLKMVLKLLYK